MAQDLSSLPPMESQKKLLAPASGQPNAGYHSHLGSKQVGGIFLSVSLPVCVAQTIKQNKSSGKLNVFEKPLAINVVIEGDFLVILNVKAKLK